MGRAAGSDRVTLLQRRVPPDLLTPALVAVLAILWARLPADEIAHPLDRPGNVAT